MMELIWDFNLHCGGYWLTAQIYWWCSTINRLLRNLQICWLCSATTNSTDQLIARNICIKRREQVYKVWGLSIIWVRKHLKPAFENIWKANTWILYTPKSHHQYQEACIQCAGVLWTLPTPPQRRRGSPPQRIPPWSAAATAAAGSCCIQRQWRTPATETGHTHNFTCPHHDSLMNWKTLESHMLSWFTELCLFKRESMLL